MRWASLGWAPRRYSYGAVLAAVAVGTLVPGWATWILGPALLVGLVLLGVAHGACDQWVVPAMRPALARRPGRYWVVFLGGYLALAATVALLWWQYPALALALFLGLTAWHWGSADAPAGAGGRRQWVAHSLLRGLLLFAVPLLCWPTETLHLVNGLLTLTGAALLRAAAVGLVAGKLGLVVVAGHLLLWASYCRRGQSRLALADAGEIVLLTALLVVLPPVLSAGVYFVGWHSLRHVLRMNELLSGPAAGRPARLGAELKFFLRRAAPLLLVSVAALALLYGWAWARGASGNALLALALLAASVVTLPHALLVTLGLDAARWRRPAGRN